MLHPFYLFENDAIIISSFFLFVSLLRFLICTIAAWTSDDLSGRLPILASLGCKSGLPIIILLLIHPHTILHDIVAAIIVVREHGLIAVIIRRPCQLRLR